MIAHDSIFYTRVIEPATGRLVKQDTFLCASLKFIGSVLLLGAGYWVFIQFGVQLYGIFGR